MSDVLPGLIFALIAIAWLAYLVPLFLRSRDQSTAAGDESTVGFADSMRVISRGTAALVDQDGTPIRSVEISTPLTRRAAVRDLQRLEDLAAQRRRRVLITLAAVASVVVAVCALGHLPWFATAVPGVLLIGFVVVARFSVTVLKRDLDKRHSEIMSCSDESTVMLQRIEEVPDEKSVGLQLTSPVRATSALWDPLPITMPTYVSKPLAPRTVRTIDLSGSDADQVGAPADGMPVTADGPTMEPVEQPDTTIAPIPVEARETEGAQRDVG